MTELGDYNARNNQTETRLAPSEYQVTNVQLPSVTTFTDNQNATQNVLHRTLSGSVGVANTGSFAEIQVCRE